MTSQSGSSVPEAARAAEWPVRDSIGLHPSGAAYWCSGDSWHRIGGPDVSASLDMPLIPAAIVAAAVAEERATVEELTRALDYSNNAREIMRAEKEHGWREAQKWEAKYDELAEERGGAIDANARAAAALAEVSRLREQGEAAAADRDLQHEALCTAMQAHAREVAEYEERIDCALAVCEAWEAGAIFHPRPWMTVRAALDAREGE